MGTILRPIIFETEEKQGFLKTLETNIAASENGEFLLNYPVVYIHEWKSEIDNPEKKFSIYVGESNDIVQRTREHYQSAAIKDRWQTHLINDGATPTMYVIGHPHFNKSLTLDIENRLMLYMMGMGSVSNTYNGRGNNQGNYYSANEFDDIFSMIWRSLRKRNKELFLSESDIKDSAIFKASPLHKLTEEQNKARKQILNRVHNAIINDMHGQLIFVEGEAGTGKTVLTSSLFYELLAEANEVYEGTIKCAMMVNHDEQITVYREIAKRLQIQDRFGADIVCKPTQFINRVSPKKPIDVAFIDEGHLMLTQGRQSYRGKNQLEDIMARARVTIVMFDENQILTAEEYWEPELLKEKRDLSREQGNYIELNTQLRISCAPTTMEWIDGLTKEHVIRPLAEDSTGYEIKVFDSPKELHREIVKKASKDKSRLSRVVATYDWDYSSIHPRTDAPYWGVEIGDFFLPWNRELEKGLSRKEKKKIKSLAWAEQPQTINEAGSTFTIQGFDLSFAGVILGPSVTYRNGKIVFDPSKSFSDRAVHKRKLSDGSKKVFGELLLSHELRVLLTRGVKGLYIYAYDEELRKALKNAVLVQD